MVVTDLKGGSGANSNQSNAGSLVCLPQLHLENAPVAALERICMLRRLVGQEQFSKLSENTRAFRRSSQGGAGFGKGMTVVNGSSLVAVAMQKIGLLPQNVLDAPFVATVSPENFQKFGDGNPQFSWTRKFGDVYITSKQKCVVASFLNPLTLGDENSVPPSGILLQESLPDFLGNFASFQIRAQVVIDDDGESNNDNNNNNNEKEKKIVAAKEGDIEQKEEGTAAKTTKTFRQVKYTSCAFVIHPFLFLEDSSWRILRFLSRIQFPLPKFIAPTTNWKETETEEGWKFRGEVEISPILSKLGAESNLLIYGGDFVLPSRPSSTPSNTSSSSTSTTSSSAATACASSSSPSSSPSSASKDPSSCLHRGRRVIIAGGTGMLGQYLVRELLNNNNNNMVEDVIILSRDARKHCVETAFCSPSLSGHPPPSPSVLREKLHILQYDAKTGRNWSHFITDNTVLINLAGENLASAGPAHGWSDEFKKKVTSSRTNVTNAMIEAVKESGKKPIAFLAASGTGIYGNQKDKLLDENTSIIINSNNSKTDFRSACCVEIEEAAGKMKSVSSQTHVFALRVGLLLCAKGGFFPWVELASRCGVSRFGGGNQFVPWCHVRDAARSIAQIATSTDFPTGEESSSLKVQAVNIVSPSPVTNKEMMRLIGKQRGFWFANWIPLPEALMKLTMGEQSVVLLESTKIASIYNREKKNEKKEEKGKEDLEKEGRRTFQFVYQYPEFEKALSSWECNVK